MGEHSFPQTDPYIFSHCNKEKAARISYFDETARSFQPGSDIITDSIISVNLQGFKSKQIFQYDGNGNISQYLTLSNTGTGWDSVWKDLRFYDENNYLLRHISLGRNYSGWDSLSQYYITYSSSRIAETVLQSYNTAGWENVSHSTYDYTGEGYVKNILGKRWLNNQWVNDLLATYFYSNSALRDSLLFQIWNNNQWRNDRKTIFYYSNNGIDIDSLIGKQWNGSSWLNIIKRIIVNDNNHNQIEQLDQIWNGNGFTNDAKRYYTYNSSRYFLSGNFLLWEGNQWIQENGDLFISNPDGLTEVFIANYIYGYYSNTVGVTDHQEPGKADYFLSDNYPNPFNSSTNFSYRIPSSGFVELKVYNILGKEIALLVNENKSAGEYHIRWDAVDLPGGIYFYRLRAGSYMEIKKMILLK